MLQPSFINRQAEIERVAAEPYDTRVAAGKQMNLNFAGERVRAFQTQLKPNGSPLHRRAAVIPRWCATQEFLPSAPINIATARFSIVSDLPAFNRHPLGSRFNSFSFQPSRTVTPKLLAFSIKTQSKSKRRKPRPKKVPSSLLGNGTSASSPEKDVKRNVVTFWWKRARISLLHLELAQQRPIDGIQEITAKFFPGKLLLIQQRHRIALARESDGRR